MPVISAARVTNRLVKTRQDCSFKISGYVYLANGKCINQSLRLLLSNAKFDLFHIQNINAYFNLI